MPIVGTPDLTEALILLAALAVGVGVYALFGCLQRARGPS